MIELLAGGGEHDGRIMQPNVRAQISQVPHAAVGHVIDCSDGVPSRTDMLAERLAHTRWMAALIFVGERDGVEVCSQLLLLCCIAMQMRCVLARYTTQLSKRRSRTSR